MGTDKRTQRQRPDTAPRQRPDFFTVWNNLLVKAESSGAIWGCYEIAPGCYAAKCGIGWAALAKELAADIPGGFIMPGNGRVQWRYGRVWGGSLIDSGPENVESLLAMRRIVAAFVGWDSVADCWAHGRGSKLLWNYIGSGDSEPYSKVAHKGHADRVLYPIIGYENDDGIQVPITDETAYHDCTPGIFAAEAAALYDVSSAYYNLLKMIAADPKRSIRPTLSSDGIDWGQWREGEQDRLNDVLGVIGEHRELRHALLGAALGSYGWIDIYLPDGSGSGKRSAIRGMPGPFRAVGLVVTRTMRDLTHAQSIAAAGVYSNVDSILIPSSAAPRVWESHGLKAARQYTGYAEVLRRGAWGFWRAGTPRPDTRDGEAPQWLKRTTPFRASAMVVPVPALPLPDRPAYKLWLS